MKFVTIAFLVSTWAASAQTFAGENQSPGGLSTSDWSSIRAAYGANRLAAFPVGTEFQAHNFAQRWRLRFDGRGFTAAPDAGAWSWGLQLVSFGREDAEHRVESPRCIDTQGERVSYEWDDSLTEWYVNDHRGLEHGFTVFRTPVAAPVASGPKPLQLTLAVRGDLLPQLGDDGRRVTFVDNSGVCVVNYAGLTVFDADGVALPAWLEPASLNCWKFPLIRLSVDDTNARYPLTIDPIAQQAYLKASNTGDNDDFGYSVAVSGDTVVVGALFEASNATGVNGDQTNNAASNSGAAYVFVRSGTIWSQQAYLKASNTSQGCAFGCAVAISGDTIVVGARLEDSNATGVDGNQFDTSAPGAGSAYVFVRNGTTWSQQAYLKASNTDASDAFGRSVSISGDTVVVGAYREASGATGVNGNQSDNSASTSGAAYIFVRNGTTWSQQAYLKASNTGANDLFGYAVGVNDNTVVVGAYQEDSAAQGVNGNQTNNWVSDSGAAYVFVRSGTTWSQEAYLKASNTDENDRFGWCVAVSNNTVAVGAIQEGSNSTGVNGDQLNNNGHGTGAAYVFVRNGTNWSQQAYLKPSYIAYQSLGCSIAMLDNTIVVGAYYEPGGATGVNGDQVHASSFATGAAYVFDRTGTSWQQIAYLKASNTGSDDFFGYSVAVSEDTIVVGALYEDSNSTGVNGNQANNSATNSGAAYVFTILECPGVIGDMNCDCASTIADVYAFTQALLTGATNPGCPLLNGDTNSDGVFNGADIQGFVDLLVP